MVGKNEEGKFEWRLRENQSDDLLSEPVKKGPIAELGCDIDLPEKSNERNYNSGSSFSAACLATYLGVATKPCQTPSAD